MENKKLTVVIPTHNRVDTLKKCLKALCGQTYSAADYGIIVVDDGSTDGTAAYAEALKKDFPVELACLRQENKGPAAARNLGIKAARGEIILFIGDDIIADSRLLEEHAAWHAAHPGDEAAMLGYTTWSGEITITPFMKWLESSGLQFGYGALEDGSGADPARFFYTSNLSVKRAFLTANGLFDEDFPYAAFEDMELGLRLGGKGLSLFFNRAAVGLHYHYTSLEDACARMIKVGEAGELLKEKTGKPRNAPGARAPLALQILRALKFRLYYRLAEFFEKRAVKAPVFGYVMDYCCRTGAGRYRGKGA
ncbi:MAG: hypothetical protein A2X28_06015 [Elusimicrobia bacterium GWA2_56_46]|nr:MAG: hypothetical protein A2X28_06015 [Elusimicrobia bacterium GWA2_56_46]OGR54587.1 MAG: hypothetical protein A2X39_02065 [Elusimicrobia bacterium GWC2_56_31]HBB65751.1 hypothetical protein [Elusimicrobiota bacterium]HBW23931.1 hypothetical protein [Elusimicrobiota bacterium]